MSLLGRVVRSVKGRDKGMYFAVIGEDENYLVLADGKKRRLENPKHKKPKHVEIQNILLEEVLCGKLTDKELRQAIKQSKRFFD